MKNQEKRIYSAKSFASDALSTGKNLTGLIGAMVSGRIDGAFRERMMLAVTGVNQCRYCTLVHSAVARLNKVDQAQIGKILAGNADSDVEPDQQTAIEFALHYAQTKKTPDPEMVVKLYKQYGKQKADDIVTLLDAIYFSNLTGNTFDAFLDRLNGQKDESSSLAFELALAYVLAPILGPQSLYLFAREKLKG